MADPLVIERVSGKLAEAAQAMRPEGLDWNALARVAVDATAQVVTVTEVPLPPAKVVVMIGNREGSYQLISRVGSLIVAGQVATDYLTAHPTEKVWIAELKRGLTGA